MTTSMTGLPRLETKRKTGEELFTFDGTSLEFNLLDFWKWSVSDLVSNATRGRLAEYIVARALRIDLGAVRNEWDAYDLLTPTNIKVEVKSAAYLQSWHQRTLSPICFKTRKTRGWDADTSHLAVESRRQADVYVFALLGHKDKSNLNPMELSQWQFYVLATRCLDERQRSQHSITLKSLETLCGRSLRYDEIRDAVEMAGASRARSASAVVE